jgi:hypothetical protein
VDVCGTCDLDPANDCAADCAGAWGGAARLDMCGRCDADATNDCSQDCAGAWGGAATTDMCETCDADATNDCTQDCTGAWGGAAVLDACGRCTGGTSGATACPTVVLYPVADATVREDSPTANYGTDADLQIWAGSRPSDRNVFLRFDLSSLPAGAVVRGATLEAHAYDGYAIGGDGNVYTSFVEDDSWGETTINWSNQPATDGLHYGHWWLWYSTPRQQVGRNSDPSLVPLIQRELGDDSLISFRLNSPGYDTRYRSREYSEAAQRPSLTIGYLPSTTVTLEAAADSWVGGAGTHGSDATLEVDRSLRRAYVRFDLSGVPATAEVVEAELTMTAYRGFAYGGDGNVYVYRVADGWSEATLDSTNEPTADTTSLGHWWLWYNSTPSDKVGRLASEALRAAVETETQGDRALSVRLNSPGYRTSYRSREHTTAAQRPSLRVRYILP